MSLLRQLKRAGILGGRWLGYVARQHGREPVGADFSRWWSTTVRGRPMTALDLPWFTFPATRFLEQVLRPGQRVFEWGSGASTLFFARRSCRVTTVEHDQDWAESLAPQLAAWPAVDSIVTAEMHDYVQAIERFPSRTFDLVVIDGVERGACLRRAMCRLGEGAMLLIDDSERSAYREDLAALSPAQWQPLHFPGPRPSSIWPVFSRTSIFRRIGSLDGTS